jgi:NAD(P)-dependent dehydrogenase (short-subunit alcohol dehydrogenase family)
MCLQSSRRDSWRHGAELRTALVTGANIGIGRATVKTLAAEDVKVAAVARRKELLEALVQECEAASFVRPIATGNDMMAPGNTAKLGEISLKALGHLDILVNNLGQRRPLPVVAPEEAWEEAMMINFTTSRQLTEALLPHMIERRSGRIINLVGSMEPDGNNAAAVAIRLASTRDRTMHILHENEELIFRSETLPQSKPTRAAALHFAFLTCILTTQRIHISSIVV